VLGQYGEFSDRTGRPGFLLIEPTRDEVWNRVGFAGCEMDRHRGGRWR
jgi:hypothetical protein